MDPADFKKLRADAVALAQIQARTGHLPPGAPLRQRVWHVEHATDQAPMCMGCGQTAVKWNTKISDYRRFCSPKCAHGHDSVRAMPGTRDLAGSWLRPSRMCCVQITV